MIIKRNSSGSYSAFQMIAGRPLLADMPTRGQAITECFQLIESLCARSAVAAHQFKRGIVVDDNNDRNSK